MGAANVHIRLRRPFKWYPLWPTWHFHDVGNWPCLLHTQYCTDTHKPCRYKHICKWQPSKLNDCYLSIQHYALLGNSRLAAHIVSQLQMGSMRATCAPVFENLHVYKIPFCTHVQLFSNVLTSLCSYITPKAEKGKKQEKSNQFSVLLAMTFCWQHWDWWDFIRSLNPLWETEECKHVLKAYS